MTKEDFKKFAKEEFGYDISFEKSDEPDTFESLFGQEQSPTVRPVNKREAIKLLYSAYKEEITKDESNPRLMVAYKMAIDALDYIIKFEKEDVGALIPPCFGSFKGSSQCIRYGLFNKDGSQCKYCNYKVESEDKE